jgi:SAM-dependent methyltransferase
VGIDVDPVILPQAARVAPLATLVNGDFLTYPFEPGSFAVVAAIASTHHMDLHAALLRACELLRPGGVVVVVGLARPAAIIDYVHELTGALCSRLVRLVFGYKEVCAPTVWPPPLTYAECRHVGVETLPGARFRRRLFFRYSLVWTKPPAA